MPSSPPSPSPSTPPSASRSLGGTIDVLQLFAEPTRVRLMALLAEQELTVAELTAITDLGQSRVSTHLGRLREAGILCDRKHGASTFYRMNDGAMPPEARKVWGLVSTDLRDDVLTTDRERCVALVRRRADAALSSRWPDSVAGQMERHYSPGRTWEATARGLLGLVGMGDVLDAGSGDGAIAELLVPHARMVTCLDRSARLIGAARARLGRRRNVRFHSGDMHALPFDAGSFDHVLMLNVLTYAERPPVALAEAARVLRRGGRLALVTLKAHAHLDVTSAYGHVHPGFTAPALRRLLGKAGLTVEHCGVTSRERRPPHFQIISASAIQSAPGRAAG